MRRAAVLIALAGLLAGCSIPGQVNQEIVETAGRGRSPYNLGTAAVGLALATPPIHTLLISSCKEELFMDKSRRDLCDLNHKIRGTTSAWDRAAAEARLMAYQPGEVQCTRTLGGVPDCRVVAGVPRPVTLISPNMGSN
jgi:hypothetical protein